jgi:hypothetical protein
MRSWVQISKGTWISVCCECCVLSGRGLCRRPDHSSRGVLPTVVCRCVWSRKTKPREWGGQDTPTGYRAKKNGFDKDRQHCAKGAELFKGSQWRSWQSVCWFYNVCLSSAKFMLPWIIQWRLNDEAEERKREGFMTYN